MASAKLAQILGKDAASIDATQPLSVGRANVDAVLMAKLVAPATTDKLGFLFQVHTKAAQAGGDEYADYLKKQSVVFATLVLLQPGQFSGAAAPSAGWGPQTVLDILKGDGTSRLSFPSGFLPALLQTLRRMSLPGYVGADGNGTCLLSLLVAHQESVVPLLIKEVTKLNLVEPFHGQFAALQVLPPHSKTSTDPSAQLAKALASTPLHLFLVACGSIAPFWAPPLHDAATRQAGFCLRFRHKRCRAPTSHPKFTKSGFSTCSKFHQR